jgi:hypothetical protein
MNTHLASRIAMGLSASCRLDLRRLFDQLAVTGFSSTQRSGFSSVLPIIKEMLLPFALSR